MTRLLQDGPTAQAERRGDAVALVSGEETVTYAALEAGSNRLARLLRDAGCRRGDRVALVVPKSPAAILGMLGALKADCVYVPIDPSMPAARAGKILLRSEANWILTVTASAGLVEALLQDSVIRQRVKVGRLDAGPADAGLAAAFHRADATAFSPGAVDRVNTATDAAHILFTSGSTGEPKGVVITHANVLHFLDWAIPYFGIDATDRNSGHSPLHFDLSTFDVYGTLTAGAQLHLVKPEVNILPNKLAAFIRDAALTQWFSVPSALTYLAKFDVLRDGDFPHLKRLLWCGEVFPTAALTYWMKKLPHVTFTNLYGPTEATIASSYHTLSKCPASADEAVPIGRPCPGEDLLVLDASLRPVPPGEIGELFIRGVGLSPGYWRDPEKTAAAFLPCPGSDSPNDRVYRTGDLARIGADGLVYYVCRTDSQIKSRGHRIELGEIETALHAIPDLVETAVVGARTNGFEGTAICCAFVAAANSELNPTVLRKHLKAALPGYMLPTNWLELDRLPKNANGKIDRRRLKECFESGEDRLASDA